MILLKYTRYCLFGESISRVFFTNKIQVDMAIKLSIWGARGSIPAPGPSTVRIGGNTTCVEVNVNNKTHVIIDAGTGVRPLGQQIFKSKDIKNLTLLLTHSHWDHLSGFTFFAPAFDPDSTINVYGNLMAQEVLQRDIIERNDNRYSPVNMDNLRAKLIFHKELPCPLVIDDLKITALNLNHPGNGFAYRFEHDEHSFVFITDNEIGMEYKGGHKPEELVDFCQGANLMIHDAQYLPSEIKAHHGWGHSTYEEVIDIARKAAVPHVVLTHHDPERTDEECTLLLEQARAYISKNQSKIWCELAVEGGVFNLG